MLSSILQVAAMASALSAIMTSAWLVQRRTGHTAWIDVYWTFGTGAVAAVASLFPAEGAPSTRQIMVGLLVIIWSLRLGGHLLLRTWAHGDDPRYRDLINQWGASADRRMFFQVQAQAIVALILAVSVALAAHNPRPGIGVSDVLGAALLLSGLIGEGVADWQLRRFRADAANRGKICEAGLWAWSRHPNYFFEWVCWLAYPVIAISSGYAVGWFTLLAPVCMYWILVHVSGVPPLEAHMLRSRGDEFRELQSRTRPFLPLPRLSSGR